jgi:hypothetical protein
MTEATMYDAFIAKQQAEPSTSTQASAAGG